jgi:ketosteroid isomerase-like protein
MFVSLLFMPWSLICPIQAQAAPTATETTRLAASDTKTLQELFKALIDAENRHDLNAVKSLLVVSPDSLFISKVKPLSEGDWGPYWGTTQVMGHFKDLYKGIFRIDPDYSRQKIVGLTRDVAELYIPIVITTDYSFSAPTSTAARMVLVWIKTARGWRMATDIPLPVIRRQPAAR